MVQDISTGIGIVVLSNALGLYKVDSVLAGNYRVVEAWATSRGVSSHTDFTSITSIYAPTPLAPISSAVPDVPAN